MKFALAAAAATPFMAGAAFAGPYVNGEANLGIVGSDYTGALTEVHLGYEGTQDKVSYYVQAGPALVSPDGGSTEVEISGKVGASFAATEDLSVYAEYWALSGTETTSNVKAGVKYSF